MLKGINKALGELRSRGANWQRGNHKQHAETYPKKHKKSDSHSYSAADYDIKETKLPNGVIKRQATPKQLTAPAFTSAPLETFIPIRISESEDRLTLADICKGIESASVYKE